MVLLKNNITAWHTTTNKNNAMEGVPLYEHVVVKCLPLRSSA